MPNITTKVIDYDILDYTLKKFNFYRKDQKERIIKIKNEVFEKSKMANIL